MALKSSKNIFFKILQKFACNKFLLPVAQIKTLLPYSALNYSSGSQKDVSNQIQAYIKSYEEREKLLQKKEKEFEDSKKYLANIMGEEVENMTQEKIDKAIRYLFPSALFVYKSRPMMKPPQIIYQKQIPIAFDCEGRPFHHLFYTTTPNFCQILHDAATYLEKLNDKKTKFGEREMEAKPLITEGSVWLSKEELRDLCKEKLTDADYEKFLEIFEVLVSHPLGNLCSDFIMKYRKQLSSWRKETVIKPKVLPDGTIKIFIRRSLRKTSVATVRVTYPGTGVVTINGRSIDYFSTMQSREQVSEFIFLNLRA